MDGLKPQNFYYSGGAGMKGILGEDQTKVLAEQLTHIYGKAGATLRAGRVTGAHLNVLGRMLSGQFQDVRVDMTTGGTATAAMGSRFVHIPTVDQLAQTVNVAGVKYAPMQNVTFDRGAGGCQQCADATPSTVQPRACASASMPSPKGSSSSRVTTRRRCSGYPWCDSARMASG